MKRYDLYSQDDQGNFGYANYSIPEEDGQWVDAYIAQELYNALKASREVINYLIGDGYLGYGLLRGQIDTALKKADKD